MMTHKFLCISAFLYLLTISGEPACGHDASSIVPKFLQEFGKGTYRFELDNDSLFGKDSGLTSGWSLQKHTPIAESWSKLEGAPGFIGRWGAKIPTLTADGLHNRAGIAIGQIMQTPTDLSRSDLIENDVPYAGALTLQATWYAFNDEMQEKMMRQDAPHYAHCLEILGQSPLFSSLDNALLGDMLGIFHYETRERGETAVSPKQASDHLYIVISGRAKISVYNPDSGREHILFLIGPGDGFDLISLLDCEWHNAVATALDDMEVLSTTIEHAKEWLNQHPDFNRAFLPYLGKQMHTLADEVTELSLYDTEARLARLILRYLEPNTLAHQEVRLINDLSQETIASMIGSVRVVVTRHLQKWKQEKVISGRRGHWSVLDLQALLEKAEQLQRD